MADHHYEFNVKMACGGCSGAIERVLKKTEGVKDINISLTTQIVKVTAAHELDYDTVYAKIKQTGKEIVSGEKLD